MRRLEARDWVLIAVFVPLWAAALAVHVREGFRTADRRLPFSVSSAAGADAHPTVLRPWRATGDALRPPLEPGDRLVAVDGIDLRGATAIGFFARAYTRAEGVRPVELEVERNGLRFPVVARPMPSGMRWWTILPAYVGLGLVALFLLVRARHWRARRIFFASSMSWCLYGAWFYGAGGWLTHANAILHDAASLVGTALLSIFALTEAVGAPSLSRPKLVLAGVLALAVGGIDVWLTWLPVPPGGWILDAYNVLLGLTFLVFTV